MTNSIIIERTRGWRLPNFREIYGYRHLFYFMARRDITAVYRQTVLGFAWILAGPIMTTVVLSFVFGGLAKVPSENMPYPIFALAAVAPWSYFTGAMGAGAGSLLANSNILTKVYFPKILLPFVSIVTTLVNFGVVLLILAGMMAWYGIAPTANIVWLPFFVLLAMALAFGLALILAPLNAQFRDVSQALPLLISLGLYVTPVAYPLRLVPEPYATILELNPMAHVVNGFRWALLGVDTPPNGMTAIAVAITAVILVMGVLLFRRAEHAFTDVI